MTRDWFPTARNRCMDGGLAEVPPNLRLKRGRAVPDLPEKEARMHRKQARRAYLQVAKSKKHKHFRMKATASSVMTTGDRSGVFRFHGTGAPSQHFATVFLDMCISLAIL